jgi:hypothetical protein
MEKIPAGYVMGRLESPVQIPTPEFICFMADGKPNYIRPRDIQFARSMDSGELCVVFDGGNILFRSSDEIAAALKILGCL